MTLNEVIQKPLLTEKGSLLRESGVFVFKVHPQSNKFNIAKAVEAAFSVKVVSVNIVCVKQRPKSSRTIGRAVKSFKSSFKKAYVRLEKGQKIGDLEV